MSIIIWHSNQPAKPLKPKAFNQETDLQSYIKENPQAIPIDELGADLELTIIGREFGTSSGFIDALGVDQRGQLYLIETKLYHNPDKRRVVAQLLDYASGLWSRYANDSSAFIRAVKQEYNFDLESHLQNENENENENSLASFKINLDAGHFRLIVLMDQVEDSLKDLVNFINQNSNFSLYAVEIKYYQDEDLEIVIPHLYGQPSKKNKTSILNQRLPSTIESFASEIAKTRSDLEQPVQQLLHAIESVVANDPQATTGCVLYLNDYKQGWWLKINNLYPIFFNSNGRLYLQCTPLTVWHKVNRQLLNKLADNNLLGKTKSDKTKSKMTINLSQIKNQDIEKLRKLYLEISQSFFEQ